MGGWIGLVAVGVGSLESGGGEPGEGGGMLDQGADEPGELVAVRSELVQGRGDRVVAGHGHQFQVKVPVGTWRGMTGSDQWGAGGSSRCAWACRRRARW